MEDKKYLVNLKIDVDEINKIFDEIDEAKWVIRDAVRKLRLYDFVQIVGTIREDSPEES